MARRPDNRRNRGRRSDGPLDWLKEPGATEPSATDPAGAEPDTGPGPLLGEGYRSPSPYTQEPTPYRPDTYRPEAYRPEAYRPEAYRPDTYRPDASRSWSPDSEVRRPPARVEPVPHPDPGPGTDPAPHPDPAAPPLGRRAARMRYQGRSPVPAPVPAPSPRPDVPAPAPPGRAAPMPTPTSVPIPTAAPLPAAAPPMPPAPGGRRVPGGRPPEGPSPADETPPNGRPAPRRRVVATWLTLAALLLAAWPATMFIDSGSLFVAGPASIAPLVSVLALPVIAIGVASRHVVPTAIAVVAALVPWSLVVGYAVAGPGESSVGTNQTLRVMSVDGDNGRASAKDITQATRLYEVDVVVVTELTNTLAHDLTVAGLASLAPARWVDIPASGKHGTGLWARTAVNGLTPITGLSRPGVDGTIEAGRSRIGISVVHLAGEPLRPGPAWRNDLKQLAERPAPAQQSLIVGDLNASPWQPAFRRLTSSRWRDAADVVGQGLRPTWPSWAPLPIVPSDHVLVTPGLGVSGADTTNIVGSSHRALIVTLILPHAGG